MNIHGERTFAFIDGPNLHATVRALGFEIDYRKLLEHLRKQGHFVRVLYYTAIVEDQEFSTFRPLADWLDYNGYTMVTKPARGYTDSTGRRRFRTSMDVELAVDAMRLADKADHIILFSGEQSFANLVAALQQMGKRVTVVSTIETQPAMVADELRRQADIFIDIDSLQSLIARAGRPPRPATHHAHVDRDDRNQGHGHMHDEADGPSHTREPRLSPPATTEPALTDEPTSDDIAVDKPTIVPVDHTAADPTHLTPDTPLPTPIVRTVKRRRTAPQQ